MHKAVHDRPGCTSQLVKALISGQVAKLAPLKRESPCEPAEIPRSRNRAKSCTGRWPMATRPGVGQLRAPKMPMRRPTVGKSTSTFTSWPRSGHDADVAFDLPDVGLLIGVFGARSWPAPGRAAMGRRPVHNLARFRHFGISAYSQGDSRLEGARSRLGPKFTP